MTVRTTDLHRVYLQSLLSRRAMREEVALEMYKRAVGACSSVDDTFRATHATTSQGLRDFHNEVQPLLHELGMELREGRDDWKGKVWIALVNNDPNGVGLLATDYTTLEISYYRDIVNEIITSYPGNSIGSRQALSLTAKLEGNMTRTAGEELLKSLVSRQWLSKSKRGRYSLGPRAMLELETYLKQEYDDYVQECNRCRKLLLTGVVCAEPGCDTHFHTYCYEPIRTSRPCPKCKTSFVENPAKPIGEKAVPRVEDDFAQSYTRKKRKSRGRRGEDDDEDDDDDDVPGSLEEEEGDGSSESVRAGGGGRWAATTSRNATQRSGVQETQYEDGDEEDDELDSSSRPSKRR